MKDALLNKAPKSAHKRAFGVNLGTNSQATEILSTYPVT